MTPRKILFWDEMKLVDPDDRKQFIDFAMRRSIPGKSKYIKKIAKRLNKARKREGLKKIKVKNIKLKVPKNWELISLK